MQELHLGYRTELFSPFVQTLREVGRAQYNLNVEPRLVLDVELAEKELVDGEVDVIIGQHFTPFVSRVTGTNLTWLAVAQNRRDYKLVTRPGIRTIPEIQGKTVAIADNPCLGINMRLQLNQMGLEDKVTIAPVKTAGGRHGRIWEMFAKGEIDAALLDTPGDLEAKRRGLKVHEDTPALEIIAGECITTVPHVIEEKDEIVKNFMKTYLHAISIFLTKPDYIKQLARNNPAIARDLGHLLGTGNEELFDHFIQHWRSRWEKKPYPRMTALFNTHEKATRYDARSADVNPLTVIDMHYVKELDEKGFIDELYR
jgi:ABC-type nitrate/sulfonate/bicarbonate transport system substrate-binding protein